MGIQNFYKVFSESNKTKKLSDFKDSTIVIDANLAIFSFVLAKHNLTDSQNNTTNHINTILNLVNSFNKNNIHTIWVFDYHSGYANKCDSKGKNLKYECQQLRKKNVKNNLPNYAIPESINLLLALKQDVIVADQGIEADAICANLVQTNQAEYVYSKDPDMMLFGASKQIKKDGQFYKVYILEDLLKNHDLTLEDLIKIGIILGSDFAEKTKGIGFGTVLKKYKQTELSERQQEAFEYFTNQPIEYKCLTIDSNITNLKEYLITKGFKTDRFKKLF